MAEGAQDMIRFSEFYREHVKAVIAEIEAREKAEKARQRECTAQDFLIVTVTRALMGLNAKDIRIGKYERKHAAKWDHLTIECGSSETRITWDWHRGSSEACIVQQVERAVPLLRKLEAKRVAETEAERNSFVWFYR